MEIERKFLVKELPTNLNKYEHNYIEQGYISVNPVIRIRQYGEKKILTMKGKGNVAREEYEMYIDQEQYDNLTSKVEGIVIKKTRYKIPYKGFTIELDIFHDVYDGVIVAEVEFESLDQAEAFQPPTWFGEDVSHNTKYQNNHMSRGLL